MREINFDRNIHPENMDQISKPKVPSVFVEAFPDGFTAETESTPEIIQIKEAARAINRNRISALLRFKDFTDNMNA